jgi:heat shock protein HspQ
MADKKRGTKKAVPPRQVVARPVEKLTRSAAQKPVASKPADKKIAANKLEAKSLPTKSLARNLEKTPVAKKPTAVKLKSASQPIAAPSAALRHKSGTTGERPRKARKSVSRQMRNAKFAVGQIVRHRVFPFRGVVFDIDPVFANTEEWWLAIPADVRPKKDQPYYHLLAENAETEYIAYVSEQNLLPDESGLPLRHPGISDYFIENDDGTLRSVHFQSH